MTTNRKRLAYLVSEYPAISHTFILREVRRLRALGWDIRVASINPSARPIDQLANEEREELRDTFCVKGVGARGAIRAHSRTLATHPLAYLRGLLYSMVLAAGDPRRTFKNLMYFVEAVVIGQWMRSGELRHLHVHFASEAATVGLLAARVFPIGFSLTVHGPDEFYDTPGYYLREKIERADFIACISHFARSQLMKLSLPNQWHKLQIARLGIDPNVFRPAPYRRNPQPFEIVCVGRLVPAKGQHLLLAALAELLEQGRGVRLRLVGSGPDRESLEREVAQRGLSHSVVFEANVNQDRIRDIYAMADIFVLASSAEGIPVVLMEAMAMEIPCIATHVCGIPELIRNQIDGLLVAPSDECGLSNAIARLMDDSQLRRQIGRAGRERVIAEYELTRSVRRLAQVFSEQIANEIAGASATAQLTFESAGPKRSLTANVARS